MKRILTKLRNKSPEFRITLALALALCCTGLIATLWIWSLTATKDSSAEKAPSPLNALTQSIKSTVEDTDFKSRATGETKSTQIIDASVTEGPFDESNPYQTNN